MPDIKDKTFLTNWNEKVLIIEEAILTSTKEQAIESLVVLYVQYKNSLKTEISLYPYNNKLKELLTQRLYCIERLIKLKIIFSKEPNLDEHSQQQLLTLQKEVSIIIKLLNEHSQAIQTNQKALKKIGADEQHLQPYIFSMVADAHDYLATSKWNLINTLNLKESVVTCAKVFLHYKERVNSLNLLTYEQSEKEIEATFEKMQETIDELHKLITPNEQHIEYYKKIHALQKKLRILKDQDLKPVKTTKHKYSSANPFFSKKPRTEQVTDNANVFNELHSNRCFITRN